MPTDVRSLPRTLESDLQITGNSATSTLRSKIISSAVPTVATSAGTTAVTVIAPFAGTLSAAWFAAKDTLAAHGSNYVSFAIVNKGQAGSGTTAMLAASDANTTKTTTGTAYTGYVKRALTLHGTAGNLVVAAGDVLDLQVIATGTLANTITQGYFQLQFDVTA